MSVGEVYNIDFGPALASLEKLADQDERFRAGMLQTARAQQQATQQVAQAAVASAAAVQQQAQQQAAVRDAYKALTSELRAQQREEKALNAERDKASGSAKRQQELAAALAANRAEQQRLREEIERTTAAQQAQARAAQTAASVPPPAPPVAPATVAAADDSLSRAQQQAQADVQATTAALSQQAGAAQASSKAAMPIAAAYMEAARAAEFAAENAGREAEAAKQRSQELQQARRIDVQQLSQLQKEEKALRAEQAKAAPGQDRNVLQRQINENIDAQKSLTQDIEGTTQAIEREQEAQQRFTAEAKASAAAAKQARQSLKEESQAAAAAQREAAQQARAATQQTQQRAKEEEKASKAQAQGARAAGLLTQYEKQLTDLVEKRARATTKAEVQGYTKQIKDTQKQISELKGEADKGSGAVGGMFSRFAGAAGAAAAVAVVVGTLKDLAAQAIEAGKKADATLGKLTFARGGDTEKAGQDLAFLSAEADRLGLNINSAGASYGGFTAAATAANLPLSEARRLYLAVAGASSVLKLSSENTEGSLLALQQMVSKGSVSAEELRGQLGERLPGALAIAARALGVTEKELDKMLQRGEVVATDFLPKFARELEKTFGDGTAAAADALQANTNRIDNEWQRFLLRFVSATGGAVSSIAKFSKQANDFLDGLSPEGRTRLAAQRAQTGIKQYTDSLNKAVAQAAAQAKANGEDVNRAVEATLAGNQAALQRKLAETQAQLDAFDSGRDAQGRDTYAEFLKNGGDGLVAFQKQGEALRTRATLLKGELLVVDDLRAARKKAAEGLKEETGLLEKYRKELKLLQDQREKETDATKITGDGGFNDRILAKQKQIDALLEKQAKTNTGKLEAALAALREAERKLLDESGKARLEQLKADGVALANEQLKQDLLAIERLEDTIRQKEALVKKAGGTGADADGLLSPAQQEQINLLTAQAQRRRDETVLALERQTNARILELQAESDEKEVAQLEAKFDEEIRVARAGHNERLALELEAAKDRELVALRLSQQLRKIQEESEQQERNIKREEVVPSANALDLTADQSEDGFVGAAKRENIFRRLLANAAVDIEKDKQKRLLQEQINGGNQQLFALQNDFSEQGIKRKQALQDAISDATNDLEKLNNQPKEFNLLKALGVSPEDEAEVREALQSVTSSVVSALSEIFTAEQVAAANKAANATTAISELNSQLTQEITLRKEGSASNIATLREQIQEQKKIRAEAVKEQRKAAQQQVILDTLTQGSSVATAAAQALAALTPLGPFGFLLGIAAATTIVGAFAAAKVKAYQAAGKSGNDGGGGFFKGGYTGGKSKYEERGVVHGKEFVHTADVTDKYRAALFEPLHMGRPDLVDWQAPSLRALLPDLELPKQIRAEKQQAQLLQVTHQFAPMQAQFEAMQRELSEIKRHVGTTAARPDVVAMPDGSTMQIDPTTGSTVRRYTEGGRQ